MLDTLFDFPKLKFLEFANFKQFGEINGILPKRICEGARKDILMDPQSSIGLWLSNDEESEPEDENDDCCFIIP